MSFANLLYTIIIYPIVQIIEISYKIFDKLFDNTGIAVIGVSFTVTLLCLPLYIVAEKWQQIERDTQSKLKPGIDRIKQTFKGDEQYMILSTFYKQNHYHPMMALRSSFGLLIQIPFFMAAYSCLSKLPALQGQSFLFIHDMGQQDAIVRIGSFPINILPIAMTIINIIAGAIYTKGFPFKEKLQIYGMALLFLVILYTSPAGLVLYWTMNNVFSLVKNIFYKLKNPLKILYYLFVVGCLFISIYILFIYDGGASPKKRLAAVIPLLFLIGTPVYLKGINWILNKPLCQIQENKSNRNKLFLFSIFGLCVLTGIVLPTSLISSSVQEFSNIENYTSPINFIYAPFWQAFGLFIVWPISIYFLFNKKIQTLIAYFLSFLLISFSINSFVFSGNYGTMDITLKFIGGMQAQTTSFIILNIILNLLILILIPFILSRKRFSLFTSLIFIVFISFTFLGIINTVKIQKEYKHFTVSRTDIDNSDFSPKIHLSKIDKNVIIIMLDRAESSFFPYIIKNFPELNEKLSGFTFYPNTISCNGHTLMGSPALYGGYEYTPDEMNKRKTESLKTKHNEALMVLPKLFTESSNFHATIADLSWANYSYTSDMTFTEQTDKITPLTLKGRYTGEFKKEIDLSNQASLVKAANRNLIFVSLFRSVLPVLRPIIYYRGSWWSDEKAVDLDDFIDCFAPLYYINNITDFTSDNNNLIVMTNDSTHSNETIDFLDLTKSIDHFSTNLEGYDINVACIMQIANFADYLRANNAYDNTKIIIIADHGIGYGATAKDNYDIPVLNSSFMKDHLNPLLLVKDFNSSQPLQTDMTFMTNADVPTLACNDVIEKPINPFTGKMISSESKKNGILITTDDIFMPHHSKSSYLFTVKPDSWYRVKDNIFIDNNWTQEAQ